MHLSEKIKKFRIEKGFTQEELAEKAGLSLRTIQRIEKGKTEARGDTLRRITQALGVSPDDILDWQLIEDTNLLSLLHISQLSFLAFPLLGAIIPMAIWILKKDKIKGVNESGINIINFQLTWSLVFFGISISFIVFKIFHLPFPSHLYVTLIPICYGWNILLIIRNFFRLKKDTALHYKPVIPFLS